MDLLPVKQDDRWGYMDKTGKLVIPPKYHDADFFHEDLARIKMDNKWGYIDKEGKTVIHPQFNDAGNFSDGLARVQHGTLLEKRWAFIDKTGKIVAGHIKGMETGAYKEGATVTRETFDQAGDFHQDLARVKTPGLKGKWGFIDKTGNMKIPAKYDHAGDFSADGLANVEMDGRWGFIDRDGKTVINFQFSRAEPFSEDRAQVMVGRWPGGKWGYIDKTGKFAINPKYEKSGPYSDGLARVKTGNDWGYIDKDGKVAIPARYSDAGDFVDSVARVRIGGLIRGEWVYIDNKGNTIQTTGGTTNQPANPE